MAEQTHNFKEIAKVPDAKDFIDIVLSKTQRKTPTVVRPGYKITRIREFYARKIKFTQANYHEKLTEILEQFPRLEELHPFYSDLINVLYSKDHYKLALGQINTARTIVDNIAKDYLHLIKFGDSLYRCKQLKRAALGRMSTAVKRLNASLGYLEEVRQHLSRLPGIDPETRTLLITGFPNVGKSSFVNKVSRANVEVQPYAFTTKSIFVGHTDYKYLRYQVIDTPGILDHPLEARNTIEMQAITALAHLHAIVLFFVDISETCGYSIKQQVSLYHNIKPLFMNKPMLVVANKIDLKKFDALDPEDRKLVESVAADRNTQIIQMSNASEEGINTVKATACEQLLEFRVQKKAANSKRVNDVINRLDVALPVPRDNKVRSTSIPDTVRTAPDSDRPKRVLEKELEAANGGAGVYVSDWRKQYLIPDEYKYDLVPEIIDGKNIADFYDPDIEAHLDALEKEEAELEAQWAEQAQDMDADSDLDEEQKALVAEIREKKALIKEESALRKGNNRPVVPRKYKAKSFAEVKDGLGQVGVDADKLLERSNASKRKRTPSVHAPSESERPASASRTRSRSRSKAPEDMAPKMDGLRNVKQKKLVDKIAKQSQRARNLDARASESDRHVFDLKPKHLFSGKRTIGKTDRR